ncbi:MAG: hypothetical protein SVT56_11560 [Chloroflexota bacterium]|nr:hypothetical protein [Chloroflexota bacterium]
MRRLHISGYVKISKILVLLGLPLFCLGLSLFLSAITETETRSGSLGKLAYIQGNNPHSGNLWVKDLLTGQTTRLTTDGYSSQPRWSPSGKWLAFQSKEQIGLIEVDSHHTYSLTTEHEAETFAWSPKQDQLAYVTNGHLEVIFAGDEVPVTLVEPEQPSMPDLGQVKGSRIVWNPDASWIAYVWQERQSPNLPVFQEIWKVSLDGKEKLKLYPNQQAEEGEIILDSWSYDGRLLFFWQSEVRSQSVLADGVPLYALSIDNNPIVGLATSVLVYQDFVEPAPTTDQVAVIVGEGRLIQTNKTLHLVLLTTKMSETLTSPELAIASLAWSPNGEHIVYTAMPDRGQQGGGKDDPYALTQRKIWLITLRDQETHQLTNKSGYSDNYPVWSNDSSNLIFPRINEGGIVSLWIVSIADKAPRQLVNKLFVIPSGWHGYYGYIQWDNYFDWWTATALEQNNSLSKLRIIVDQRIIYFTIILCILVLLSFVGIMMRKKVTRDEA